LPNNTMGGSQCCTIVSAIEAGARGSITKFICSRPDAPG
jgi:hypothetical protein